MPERLESEVLHKVRSINTLSFYLVPLYSSSILNMAITSIVAEKKRQLSKSRFLKPILRNNPMRKMFANIFALLFFHNRARSLAYQVLNRLYKKLISLLTAQARQRWTYRRTSKQASIFICPINKQRYNIDE